ncbi:MAG: single-stranded-DNA-specific exonuclease RecJ [Treponema sp.]|jgi:single-stranded-DNA-specific exonuclease|nr:single-stranded-DNA-specific exonuclease RecJ [Treponema sp.]
MKWEKKDISPDLVKEISAKYGCDLLTSSILIRRGLVSGEDIRYFLEDNERHLRNPFELPGMEDAVDRILAAKEEGEKILVFGDRDADGITGTALLSGCLESLGFDVSWRVPTGDDPYGLSIKAVEEFAGAYGTLIITVDNGISCAREVRRANELSVDVIITDHHNPPETLPEALAVINPKLRDSRYPFRDLSGCAVAYKLVCALRFAFENELYGQSVSLLNTRPLNDSWIIEIVKLRNLAETDRLEETVNPGMVRISDTRLPAFLEGQHILAWDVPLQRRVLSKIFGAAVEISMLDAAPEIGKEIPQTMGKSLLRIKELSRVAKYSDRELTELDVFKNLFTSFIQKRGKNAGENGKDLQLASIGTIADIMPLRDENRIIVRKGLSSLREKPGPGLSELLFALELSGRPFDSQDISWKLCPAINAAGRMGNPEKAVSLLLEKDPGKREALAAEIIAMNEERKKLVESTWEIAWPMAEKSLEETGGNLAVVCGEEIYRGITGLLAQRLARYFRVPAMVVSAGKDICTGSLRSMRDYDIRSLLEQYEDFFIDWGGHTFAAGFSMEKSKWDLFIARISVKAKAIELAEDSGGETVVIDAELPGSYLTPGIFDLVDRFEPYGEQNRPLTFLARRLLVRDIGFMGKEEAKHVKMTLDTGKHKWPAVYWEAAGKVEKEFGRDDTVDLVFNLSRDWFKGIETPRITVTDLKRSGVPEPQETGAEDKRG